MADEEIASRSGSWDGHPKAEKDQAVLEKSLPWNCGSMARASEDSAAIRGSCFKRNFEKAHAVFAKSCGLKSAIIGIAAAAIEARRGQCTNPNFENDQEMLAQS